MILGRVGQTARKGRWGWGLKHLSRGKVDNHCTKASVSIVEEHDRIIICRRLKEGGAMGTENKNTRFAVWVVLYTGSF